MKRFLIIIIAILIPVTALAQSPQDLILIKGLQKAEAERLILIRGLQKLENGRLQAQRTANRALAWAVRANLLNEKNEHPDIEEVEKMLSPIIQGNMQPLPFETAIWKEAKAKGWTYIIQAPKGKDGKDGKDGENGTEQDLTPLLSRIQALENTPRTPNVNHDEIKQKISQIKTALDTKADLKRVQNLETIVSNQSDQIAKNETRIQANQNAIKGNQDAIAKQDLLVKKTILVLTAIKARDEVFWPYLGGLIKAGATYDVLGLDKKNGHNKPNVQVLGFKNRESFKKETLKKQKKEKIKASPQEIEKFFKKN